jgi:hypothetical protein
MTTECFIRAEPVSGLLRLEAVARSNEALRGRYSLSVLKRSASGTSSNSQSGSFSLSPGRDGILTTLMLEGSAQGHYQAKLTVTWDQGSVSCVSP